MDRIPRSDRALHPRLPEDHRLVRSLEFQTGRAFPPAADHDPPGAHDPRWRATGGLVYLLRSRRLLPAMILAHYGALRRDPPEGRRGPRMWRSRGPASNPQRLIEH